MLTTLRARTVPCDRGSAVVGMLAVLIVTLSLVATLSTVMSGLNSARNDQNRTNAFQYANAGIDQALYRIDRRDLPTTAVGAYTPTVVAGTLVSFTETVTSGASSFLVEAAKDPPGQDAVWTVRSTGTDPSGRRRLAIASITADVLFDNGFFTHGVMYLTGNQTSPQAYDSVACPTAAVSCALPLPVPARLGTNSVVDGASATFESFVASWDGFNMYGRATQAAADLACGEGRCGTGPKVRNFTNQLGTPYPDEPSASDGCPSGGTIGATGTTTTVQPGDYVCQDLELRGTVVIGSAGNGTGSARFWVRGAFTVQAGGVVNQAQRPNRFQVFQRATPGGGTVCDARIWGLLLLPGLEIDCSGSHQPEFWGAVVAEIHRGTGNQFQFHYDVNARHDATYGRYHVEDWRECPVGASDC
ncbi:MAG: pilus assembly PilX family protein [Actinomycetota bacterium]